jgi:hypothetical protein
MTTPFHRVFSGDCARHAVGRADNVRVAPGPRPAAPPARLFRIADTRAPQPHEMSGWRRCERALIPLALTLFGAAACPHSKRVYHRSRERTSVLAQRRIDLSRRVPHITRILPPFEDCHLFDGGPLGNLRKSTIPPCRPVKSVHGQMYEVSSPKSISRRVRARLRRQRR